MGVLMEAGTLPVTYTAVLAGLGFALWAWCRRPLRGTTLTAAWYWCLGSLLALVGCELVVVDGSPWSGPLRFAAATTTFCPSMAILGAKRPQDRAWGFVVLSLWAILALPAAEVFFLQSGQTLEVHQARAWFLWVLILLGAANMAPTRFWPSALLLCLGQVLLLGEYLPLVPSMPERVGHPLGLTLLVAAAGWAALQLHRPSNAARPMDRVWLDFRDFFGALWGLRVAQRINADAATYAWQGQLTWRGFRTADGAPWPPDQLHPEVRQAAQQSLHNLLRRFVSPEWIASRLEQSLN